MKTIHYDGISNSYRHRTMRAVVCALWVLTTASCAHAAASFTVLSLAAGRLISTTTLPASAATARSSLAPAAMTLRMRHFLRCLSLDRWLWHGRPGRLHGSFASGVSADGSVIVGTTARLPAQPFAGPLAPAWSAWATCRATPTASPTASAPTARSSSAQVTPPPAAKPSAGPPVPAWSVWATCRATRTAPPPASAPMARSSSATSSSALRRPSLSLDRRLRHGRPGPPAG